VNEVDAQFFSRIEDSIPLEETIEHRTLAEAGALQAGGNDARAFVREFDSDLGDARSRLVDYGQNGAGAVAAAVRSVLGLTRSQLSDAQALERVLSPVKNPYHGEALVLTTVSKLTRALSHAHYTFQKKLSHTADSQDQRHRMTPASRPVLHAHFVAGMPDVIVPDLIEAVPEAKERFLETVERTWRTIESLLDSGVPHEFALYLLPNAFPIRFYESGDLLHLHHKWVHRLCFTAQEEIWRASVEEVQAVTQVQPEIGRWIRPPCKLRQQAGIAPHCPEGPRYCGVPVWKQELSEYKRLI
jgi:hypothetical protein